MTVNTKQEEGDIIKGRGEGWRGSGARGKGEGQGQRQGTHEKGGEVRCH